MGIKFHVLTIFPKIFDSYLNESLIKRAREKKLIDIKIHNLRDFTKDKHKKVDDRPFGGGPGMVMGVQPIYYAVQSIQDGLIRANKRIRKSAPGRAGKKARVILFSLRGKKLDEKTAKRLSKYKELILICGRYEGVDERVAQYVADEEISIGDYVLAGGELPALVLVEATSRFLPGFLGKFESLESKKGSYVSYTRPPVFYPHGNSSSQKISSESRRKRREVWAVPKVLQSGNHAEIEKWRRVR